MGDNITDYAQPQFVCMMPYNILNYTDTPLLAITIFGLHEIRFEIIFGRTHNGREPHIHLMVGRILRRVKGRHKPHNPSSENLQYQREVEPQFFYIRRGPMLAVTFMM